LQKIERRIRMKSILNIESNQCKTERTQKETITNRIQNKRNRSKESENKILKDKNMQTRKLLLISEIFFIRVSNFQSLEQKKKRTDFGKHIKVKKYFPILNSKDIA
jgi:hypothetical protein